jgi:hypothetical protein
LAVTSVLVAIQRFHARSGGSTRRGIGHLFFALIFLVCSIDSLLRLKAKVRDRKLFPY